MHCLKTKHIFVVLVDRNPKLEDIPNLANDLKFISELKRKVSDQEKCSRIRHCNFDQPKPLKLVFNVDRVRDCEVDQPKPLKIVLKQDLNCLPDSETESMGSENDQNEHSELGISSDPTLSLNVDKLTF